MNFDTFDPEETTQDTITAISHNSIVETPLFDIHFKKFTQGDNTIDAARSTIARDVFNSLCDRLVIQLATKTILVRKAVCGQDALADETAPKFLALFTEEGSLKEEFYDKLDEAGVVAAELGWTFVKACHDTIEALTEARKEMLPFERTPIQYAYDTQSSPPKPVYDLKEAIRYRVDNSSTLRGIKDLVARNRRSQNQDLSYSEAAAALNF